jgi:hypothetical protein
MLNTIQSVQGSALAARDGNIGTVKDFLFDDQYWAVRYLVADTGGWLPGRRVLIAPYALGSVDKARQEVAVELTKQRIKDSPDLNTDKPVSRQFEESYYGYYGYPTYWTGPYMWGSYPRIVRDRAEWKDIPRNPKSWDPHLRSAHEVEGYHIQATDGDIGHVRDFVLDDELWAIRYLIVDTLNWWPGKRVLISPQWIERVSWGESKVFLNLTRAAVKSSPEYSEQTLVTRDYEDLLHRHYQRPGYWAESPIEHAHSR